jgi:uncharacterized protein (TIGR02246 family)
LLEAEHYRVKILFGPVDLIFFIGSAVDGLRHFGSQVWRTDKQEPRTSGMPSLGIRASLLPFVSLHASIRRAFTQHSKNQSSQGGTVKRTLIWSSLGLILFVSTAWAQSGKSGGTEQAVADLEQKWLQSQKSNNPDMIAPYLADKMVITSSKGKARGKEDFLKEQKATKFSSVDYSDMKVTVFGNTAIATGLFKGSGTDPDGKPLDMNERFTDTWVKMSGGKWQCVASHSSPVKM